MEERRTLVADDHRRHVLVGRVLDRHTAEVVPRTLESRRDARGPVFLDLPAPAHQAACRSLEWVRNLPDDLSVELELVDPIRISEMPRSPMQADRHDVRRSCGDGS